MIENFIDEQQTHATEETSYVTVAESRKSKLFHTVMTLMEVKKSAWLNTYNSLSGILVFPVHFI